MSSMTKQSLSVAILGCGFMGTALLRGVLASTHDTDSPVKKYYACVQRAESATRLLDIFSHTSDKVEVICGDNRRAVSEADVVVLGFQPGDVQAILNTSIATLLRGKLIISMLAGVSCKSILTTLHTACQEGSSEEKEYRIVRMMPSIGALINESVSLISQSTLDEESKHFVEWFVGKMGSTEIVSEELMNTAVAVSSASHALTVTAVDALTDGSVSRGLPRSTALKLTAQCLRSAASLLLNEMSLEELKDSMSVPRGITTESWINLDKGNVRSALSQTVRNAVDYAEGMDKSDSN